MHKKAALVGQTFGAWAVLEKVAARKRGDVQIWLCSCKCGNKTQRVSSHQLIAGRSKGCRRCAVKPRMRLRPFEALFLKASRSAARERHGFSLTYDEFVAAIQPECHYCLAPLVWAEHNVNRGAQAYNLDRKDNALGYSAQNVVACCKRCNHGKGARFTHKEWFGMTAYFRLPS
ncbi:MAG: hypothetical protein JWN34_2029 [Bryobacterales bacterium]|nr:hypothetical protein [Bryobacterales bacterium]